MPSLPASTVLEIAHKVATHWRKRGIVSYSYEDMVQDAAMAVLNASISPTYADDPGATPEQQQHKLRGYCYTAARNEVYHRCTRAIAGASAKGHDQTSKLGMTKTVQFSPGHLERSRTDFNDINTTIDLTKWREKCRKRLRRLHPDLTDEDLRVGVLSIVRDSNSADSSTYTPARLRAITTRIRRHVQNDRFLYNLAREAT